jgi:hypothetical protein
MKKLYKPAPAWRRLLSACWKLLLTVLRTALLLLLVVIPIPMVLRPYIPKPAPRNPTTQVKREE